MRLRRRTRDRIDRLWTDRDPPTLPDGLPHGGLWDLRRQLPVPADVELQQSFDFAQRVGAVLLARGASIADVEASVVAAAVAMGLARPEVDVTFTSILVSVRPDLEQAPLTSVRVVRQRSDDHARLAAAHNLLVDLTEGRVDRQEAFERLAAIERQRRPYPRWFVTVARGVLAGAIVVQLRGTWSAVIVAFVTAMVIDRIGRLLSGRDVPGFYLTVVGGCIATLAAVATTALGSRGSPSLMVAGGIVVLLPGVVLVNAVRDALSGFLVTGTARAFEVLLLVGGLVSGVALGLSVGRAFDVDMSVVPDTSTIGDLPVRVVAASVAAAAAAVAFYAPRRLLPAAAAAGGLGMLVLASMEAASLSPVAASAVAALVVGAGGYGLAAVQRALPLSVVVPGIIPLLPGLTIYTGMLLLTSGRTTDGLVTLLDAGSRGLALAGGVLVAELVGQPVRRRILRERDVGEDDDRGDDD